MGHEPVGVVGDGVAEGTATAFPQPFGGFAFHAVDHAVDDGVAFELGEHAQHLHQHPAHRRGGVERFRGGAEHHAALVEFVEQGHHVPQVPGEPVHSVDQQHIDQPRSRGGQCPLQVIPLGGRARGVVGKPHGHMPTGLRLHIGLQPFVLRLDGVGLVFVVGGTPHVDPDPYRVEIIQRHRRVFGASRGARSPHEKTPSVFLFDGRSGPFLAGPDRP